MLSERPIAVQFSDLRGFSSFTAQHGDRTAFEIAQRFMDLVGSKVEEHQGRLLKTYGDGVMTSFDDPETAVRCAVAMQETLAQAYPGGGDEKAISAGIGLTWGPAIQTENDLFGHSVNLAKRLADEAKGGQIMTSSSVAEAVVSPSGCTFRDLGPRALKGIGEHRLYEVVWRAEVARVETADHRMGIILTEDDHVVVEFSKTMKDRLAEVVRQLEAVADQGEGTGPAYALRRTLARRVAKSLPSWAEWMQSRAGLGIQHGVQDVQAKIERGRLVLMLGPTRRRIDLEDVDPEAARAFVERLSRRKAGGGKRSP